MKKILFETIKSMDIIDAQRACKEFFDAIQQIPVPNKTKETPVTKSSTSSTTPSRDWIRTSMNDVVTFEVDVFGYQKHELSVKVKDNFLIVIGVKKSLDEQNTTIPKFFETRIPFYGMKLFQQPFMNNSILIIKSHKTNNDEISIDIQ